MDTTLLEGTPWRAALLVSVPLVQLAAALLTVVCSARPQVGWRVARAASVWALAAALLSLAWLLRGGAALGSLPVVGLLHLSLRSDALSVPVLLLVSFIGWVIVGYSRTYLQGEPGQARYMRSLMLTLASVSLLVITNNLLLLALAWVATSLSLHGLLTFYDQRPQALLAAHKKFMASRVADACLISAVALIGHRLGTLEIDQAIFALHALNAVPLSLQIAAVLLACSALLKCAQLPVHGWLIQVMEAPTPVSALLHAGVVNLGGFLLIRVGALVADVPAAQALLVCVGSVTAVVAALVMLTRVSIKVHLAWSTCAQMGFMLTQCGLGLYDLALLHLVAHSLYKAHAFLGSGGAVEQNRLQQMTPVAAPSSFAVWLVGALVGLLWVAGAAWLWGFDMETNPALWAVGVVLALALVPLLTGPALRAGGWWPLAGLAGAFGVALVYFGLHVGFGHWLAATSPPAPAATGLVVWVMVCFTLLFVVQGAVRTWPDGVLARRLYPTLFAGLYLDELFTRLVFRLWPARVPALPGTLQRPPAAAAASRSTR